MKKLLIGLAFAALFGLSVAGSHFAPAQVDSITGQLAVNWNSLPPRH